MGKTQINLQIGEDKKEDWVEYVDSHPEANNLSHLIRTSVAQYMAESGRRDTSERTRQSSEASGEVLNALNRIDNKVSELGERMDAVERETEVEATYDLQKTVFAVLPIVDADDFTKEPLSEDAPPRAKQARRNSDPLNHFAEMGSSPEEIASKIGANKDAVQDALDALIDSTSVVNHHGVERHGETDWFYWRNE